MEENLQFIALFAAAGGLGSLWERQGTWCIIEQSDKLKFEGGAL